MIPGSFTSFGGTAGFELAGDATDLSQSAVWLTLASAVLEIDWSSSPCSGSWFILEVLWLSFCMISHTMVSEKFCRYSLFSTRTVIR